MRAVEGKNVFWFFLGISFLVVYLNKSLAGEIIHIRFCIPIFYLPGSS